MAEKRIRQSVEQITGIFSVLELAISFFIKGTMPRFSYLSLRIAPFLSRTSRYCVIVLEELTPIRRHNSAIVGERPFSWKWPDMISKIFSCFFVSFLFSILHFNKWKIHTSSIFYTHKRKYFT